MSNLIGHIHMEDKNLPIVTIRIFSSPPLLARAMYARKVHMAQENKQ